MHSFLPKFFLFILVTQAILAKCCMEHEREVLLELKASVSDPSNRLSSWSSNDCCNWAGIRCSNRTGHVIQLDLRNSLFYMDTYGYYAFTWNNHSLTGKINPTLLALSDLKYLDLSYNNFSGNKFPNFTSSFTKLKYLNLSYTGFSGMILPQLGNLSRLQYLDLSYMPNTFISDVWWLSHLTSLKYLDMSEVDFQGSIEWVRALNMLPMIEHLILGGNNLTTISTYISVSNFSRLERLVIYNNNFNAVVPDWIGKLTNLKELYLRSCFIGPIPNQLGNLNSLNALSLRENYFEGPMPPLQDLKNLTYLEFSDANFGEDIRDVISKLANETLEKLEELVFWNTSLTGNLTGLLNMMPNVKILAICRNNINGTIPTEIGKLSHLEYLFLDTNLLTGEVSEVHLSSLSNLKFLSLGYNSIAITVDRNWIPSFKLTYVDLGGCKLGPQFPHWLQTQSKLISMHLPNTGIKTIPNWFWKLPSISYVDLSHNQISGKLPLSLESLTKLDTIVLSDNHLEGEFPTLPLSLGNIDLSNNRLSGKLPTHIGAPLLSVLVLSNNLFNGTIEKLTCGLNSLTILNLADNNLSGNLPRCWPNTLKIVNMAHNKFSGYIPSSMVSLTSLWVLQLNNNSLTGEIPINLQFCQKMIIFDIGENKISGQIPEWIGENLKNLTTLRLRSNMFTGKIPSQIMHLTNLQVIDLASNNLSGLIPQNLELLMGMASSMDNNKNSAYLDFLNKNSVYYNLSTLVVTKDLELQFTTTLSLLRSIDLSNNNLIGEIPQNITTLIGLRNLNLSKNHLKGPIPAEIGKMQSIESLDLHMNELSGMIPQSLINLNFLTTLNLSYNNLSGKIPTGYQLQTLDDPYIYIGNNFLCSNLLNKSCNSSEAPSGYAKIESEDLDNVLLYLSVMLGSCLGFWVFCGVLLFKTSWRYCLFQTVDNGFDRLYLYVVVLCCKARKI